MRYFDADGNEISFEDVDLTKGYLQPYTIIEEHVDEVENIPEEYHFEVKRVFFTDGTSIIITSQDDDRLIIEDAVKAKFDYNDKFGRTVEGFDYRKVTDKPGVMGHPAYDKKGYYQQYILFTDEELAIYQAEEEKKASREQFLDNGYERMDNVEISIDDLTLVVADMIGA